ncbi:MAG: divergent polysaccharide deacetylase family protein [Desulfovibrio sp.]|uniref:divergent polysaccharide deacetylase family protein n=1 Tax=Desulfovibrio sp. TaxID=885 RepID=UPI0039E655BB
MHHNKHKESLQTGPTGPGGRLSASVCMALGGGLWLVASLIFVLWVGRNEPLPFSAPYRVRTGDSAQTRVDALANAVDRAAAAKDEAATQARLEALDRLVEAVLPQTLPAARWQRELTSPALEAAPGDAEVFGGKTEQVQPATGSSHGALGHPAPPATEVAPETPMVRVYTVTGPCAPLRLGLGLLDRLTPPSATALAERKKLGHEGLPVTETRAETTMRGQGAVAELGTRLRQPELPNLTGTPELADGKIRLAWTDAGQLDIFDNGRLTHRFIFPGREAQLRDLARPLPHPALVLVIDDMGQSLNAAESLAALPYPVTLAIWPHAPHAQATADLAAQRRLDVMAHVPMEPLPRPDGKRPQPGQGALWTGMQPEQLRAALKDNLSALPSAIGLNNHMGSAFTSNTASCRLLCAWLEGMGFFVLDSLTTPDSQLGPQARTLGMVSATRDVFLDTRKDTSAILEALDHAAAKARSKGYAVAIGHPYDETLRALRTWQDKAQVALVPLRRLVWHLAQKDAQERTAAALKAVTQ